MCPSLNCRVVRFSPSAHFSISPSRECGHSPLEIPGANGAEVTDQAETFALVTTDGTEQRVEHFVASMATRHAVKVEVASFAAAVTFGESDLVMVPRRSTERA